MRRLRGAAVLALLLARLACAGDEPPAFDPWRGIDRDGRIPAVEKPVAHPERWRCIPEDRIAHRGRGFIEGRFRDRSLWAATAEYRFWVIPRGFAMTPWTPTIRVERVGMALFYDVGSVADELVGPLSRDAAALRRRRRARDPRAERALPRRRRVLGRGPGGERRLRAQLLIRPRAGRS